MGLVFYLILCTLVTAAIWYFISEGEEFDKAEAAKRKAEGKEPEKGLGSGCITYLIIGFIISLCYVGCITLFAK